MANLTSADISKVVSFAVLPSAVIGTLFDHVKVMAILDAASTFQWIDPVSLHANVYPTLPPGTPNSYKGYLYAKVELLDGTVTCVGLPWIDEGSITYHAGHAAIFRIDDIEPSDYKRIRDLLLLNGFPKLTGELVDP